MFTSIQISLFTSIHFYIHIDSFDLKIFTSIHLTDKYSHRFIWLINIHIDSFDWLIFTSIHLTLDTCTRRAKTSASTSVVPNTSRPSSQPGRGTTTRSLTTSGKMKRRSLSSTKGSMWVNVSHHRDVSAHADACGWRRAHRRGFVGSEWKLDRVPDKTLKSIPFFPASKQLLSHTWQLCTNAGNRFEWPNLQRLLLKLLF